MNKYFKIDGKSIRHPGARYHSSVPRCLLKRDSIIFEGGINLYSYTGCDFVNYGDWEGLWSVDIQVGLGFSVILRVGYTDGHSFIEVKGGFGFGGGIMIDPWGRPTFSNPEKPLGRGFCGGFGLEGSVYVGPLVPIGAGYYGYFQYEEPDTGYFCDEPIIRREPAVQPKLRIRLGLGGFISIGGAYIAF